MSYWITAINAMKKAVMAPITRKTRPFAIRMRERLGVTSRVAVMVMCRYSPVIATMPRMSTNSADEPAAPTMLSMYSGFMRSWSLFSAPIALGVRYTRRHTFRAVKRTTASVRKKSTFVVVTLRSSDRRSGIMRFLPGCQLQ